MAAPRNLSAIPSCCVLGQCSQASSSQDTSVHPPPNRTTTSPDSLPSSRPPSQTLPARSRRMRAVPSASAIASSASDHMPCASQEPPLEVLVSRPTFLPLHPRSVAGSSLSKRTLGEEQHYTSALPTILPPTPETRRRQPQTTTASAWTARPRCPRRLSSSRDAQIGTVSHAESMANHDTLKGTSSPATSSASSALTSSPRIGRRPRRRVASSIGDPSLFNVLVTLAAAAAASLVFLGPLLVRAHDLTSERHPSYGLSPRELSKRAVPATYNDFIAPLRKRLGTDNITADHLVDLNLSPPATCSTLNITWDPSKGTAPFTLAIFVELWFPIAIVSIPASYADPDLSLWLYQVDLPQFEAGPIEVGNTPTVYAAITDSSGNMANTSSFITVNNSDTSCARDSTPLEFDTWSSGGPVQCQAWQLGWNVSVSSFVGPLVGMILPERRPPVLLSPPENLILDSDGTGGMNWTVAIPAGTYITYAMIDGGTGGSGGIGGKNLIGSNQYSNDNCVLENPIGLATPTATAGTMTVTPDLTTAIVTTEKGVVTTIHTVIHNANAGSNGRFGTGSIVGVALGLGAAAGILIALIFFAIYKRREKRRETRWEMPGGSDYPKGMPVDRRFVAKGNRKKGADGGSTKTGPGSGLTLNIGNGMGGGGGGNDAAGVSFTRGQSLRGSFRSLGSSAYDPRVDLDSPSSSPPTPARPILSEAPYSDSSLRSADSTQAGFFNNRSRAEGLAHDERETLIVTNPSSTSPSDPFHGKRGSIGSPRGGSSNLASAYRSVLGTPEAAGEDTYEDVQLHDRRPSSRSNSTGRDMPYRSASLGADSASNLSLYTPSSRGAIPRPRRGHSSRDDGAPPLPAFPEAYRRSPAPSSIGGGISRSATPGGTHRNGNVMIHSDAGMLMDDRLSDDDEGADQGDLLELPPQYASLPARAHSTAGRPGASGRPGGAAAAAAVGQHDSGAQTLSAATGAGRAAAARNRSRGPTGDQKESEDAAALPSAMRGAATTAQDPFAEHVTPARTQRNTGGTASDGETEEEAAQRAERGTLDRFVGDEDDDAFWLPRGAG